MIYSRIQQAFNPAPTPHELTQPCRGFGRSTHLELFLEKEQDGATSKTANAYSASPQLMEKWDQKPSQGRICA